MNNGVNVPTAQTPIFVLFLGAGLLFDGAFSLWVSLGFSKFITFPKFIDIYNIIIDLDHPWHQRWYPVSNESGDIFSFLTVHSL